MFERIQLEYNIYKSCASPRMGNRLGIHRFLRKFDCIALYVCECVPVCARLRERFQCVCRVDVCVHVGDCVCAYMHASVGVRVDVETCVGVGVCVRVEV